MLSRQFTELQGEKGREIGPHTLHFNKREKNKEIAIPWVAATTVTTFAAQQFDVTVDLAAANQNEDAGPPTLCSDIPREFLYHRIGQRLSNPLPLQGFLIGD